MSSILDSLPREELCRRIAALEKDNHRLRELLSESKQANERLYADMKRYKGFVKARHPQAVQPLMDDNAKLRELVCGLHAAYVGAIDQCEGFEESLTWEFSGDVERDLKRQHAGYENDRHRFDVAMQELGIEVSHDD